MTCAPTSSTASGPRLATRGVSPLEGLSETEVLASFLHRCVRGGADDLAMQLLQRFGSLAGVMSADAVQLAALAGKRAAAEYEAASTATREKTARLRKLREAKEAADLAAAAIAPPKKPAAKKAAAKNPAVKGVKKNASRAS